MNFARAVDFRAVGVGIVAGREAVLLGAGVGPLHGVVPAYGVYGVVARLGDAPGVGVHAGVVEVITVLGCPSIDFLPITLLHFEDIDLIR